MLKNTNTVAIQTTMIILKILNFEKSNAMAARPELEIVQNSAAVYEPTKYVSVTG